MHKCYVRVNKFSALEEGQEAVMGRIILEAEELEPDAGWREAKCVVNEDDETTVDPDGDEGETEQEREDWISYIQADLTRAAHPATTGEYKGIQYLLVPVAE